MSQTRLANAENRWKDYCPLLNVTAKTSGFMIAAKKEGLCKVKYRVQAWRLLEDFAAEMPRKAYVDAGYMYMQVLIYRYGLFFFFLSLPTEK